MLTIKDRVTNDLRIYLKSIDINELSMALKDITNVVNNPATNEENLRYALYTLLCISAKIDLIKFKNELFSPIYAKEVVSKLEPYIKLAEEADLSDAKDTLVDSIALINFLSDVFTDYATYKSLLYDDEGNVVLNDVSLADKISTYCVDAISKVDNFDKFNPFKDPSIKFIDFKELSTYMLTNLKDASILEGKKIADKDLTKIFKDNATILADEMENKYDYYPGISNKLNSDSGLIMLFSPLIVEVKLATYYFEFMNSKKFAIINFDNLTVSNFETLIKSIELLNYNILIINSEKLPTNIKHELYKALFEYAKTHFVFIHNKYAELTSYNDMLAYSKELDVIKPYEISYIYIQFPPYDAVIDILVDRKIIEQDDMDIKIKIKNELKYMGYYGFNQLLSKVMFGQDWFNTARSISKNNSNLVLEYLENTPSQVQLISADWGDISAGSKYVKEDSVAYDYDKIRIVNKENIKKILNSDLKQNQKIGCLVKYILLAGDDVSKYKELDDEELGKRITLATEIVYLVYGINYLPEVIIDPEKNGDHWGGLCVMGGKIIKYKLAYLRDFDYTFHTICHETRHSFQSFATNSYVDSYKYVYGISKNMVKFWSENNSNYLNLTTNDRSSKDFKAYYYQVIEVDANAFADDCIDGANEVYASIDFI